MGFNFRERANPVLYLGNEVIAMVEKKSYEKPSVHTLGEVSEVTMQNSWEDTPNSMPASPQV